MNGDVAALLERLEALEFDGEAENLAPLVRVARSERARYGGLLEALRASPAGAERDALEGRLLWDLGRYEEADALLERARDASLPGPGRWPAWRGAARLSLGDAAGAAPFLDRAIETEPEYAWGWFHRGVARLWLGDSAGARDDAAAFHRRAPGAASAALSAFAAAAAEEWEAALTFIGEAMRARPSQAWPWLLRAQILRGQGRLADAQDSLGGAEAREPSAALSAERALLWEQLGDLPLALKDAAAATERCPCRGHFLLKARLHACWREHERAAAECTKALRLDAADAEALFLRSQALSALGRLDQALEDALALSACDPGETAALWSSQLLMLNGRHAQAAACLDRLEAETSPEDPAREKCAFYRGYAAFLLGELEKAGALWRRGAALDPLGAMGRKSSFYAAMAEAVAAAGGDEGRRAGLLLAGLGVNPPFSATAGALRALRGCDVVFNNVSGDEMFELLRLLCADVRPLAYHQANEEAELSELLLQEVRAGKTVGFVTRGHAIVYGGLGAELVRRCKRAAVAWRCLPAVSSPDAFLARFGAARLLEGFQVLDSASLLAQGPRAVLSVPLVVFMGEDMRVPQGEAFKGVDAGRYGRLCALLESRYGARHPCFVFDHRVDQEPVSCALGELPALRERTGASAILYIPQAAAVESV